jgi:FAD/FMN-containing dehydrogenase
MKGIRIDVQRRLANAEGGVLLGELDRKTLAVGLATTMGTATDTGIAGLTLGGGMGRLMRCHGLACDNLNSVQIVTADGQLRRASATENADLFWAIRGGGGNFGVVTNFEYRLHPLTGNVLDGARVYPFSMARSVMTAMAELGEHGSDELLLGAVLVNSPPGSARPGRMIALEGTYFGDLKEGERQLAPLKKLGTPISDDLSAKSYLVAQGAAGTAPVAAPTGTSSYTKTGFLRGAPAQLIDEVARRFEAAPPSLDVELIVSQMGGAVARVEPQATAFWNRGSSHDVLVSADWTDRAQDEAKIAAVRTLWGAVEPFTQGFYVNTEPGATEQRVRATYGDNYARLVQLKNKYDPGNLFHLNANIKPTASG